MWGSIDEKPGSRLKISNGVLEVLYFVAVRAPVQGACLAGPAEAGGIARAQFREPRAAVVFGFEVTGGATDPAVPGDIGRLAREEDDLSTLNVFGQGDVR